jgi:hypothetical protein
MGENKLQEIKYLLRHGAGADWSVADRAYQKIEADARALWAVRVLDAWQEANPCKLPPTTTPVAKPHNPLGWTTFVLGVEYDGSDSDAARLAAAQAVAPTLSANVRATLGECP